MLLTIILMGLTMPRYGQSLDLCKMGLCDPERINRIYAKANRSERVTTATTAQPTTGTSVGTTTTDTATTTERFTKVTTVATTTVYASPTSAVPVTEKSTDEGSRYVGGQHVKDPHEEKGEGEIADPLGQENEEMRRWEETKLQFDRTKAEGDGDPDKAADLPAPNTGQVDDREEEQVIKEEHEGKSTTQDEKKVEVTNGTRAQKYKKVSTGDKTILRGLGAGYIILILTLAVTMLITGWFSAWGRRIRTAWRVRARRSRRRYDALKSESMTNVFDPAEDEEEADGTEQQEESGANIVRPGAVEAAEVLVAVQVHGEAEPANDIEMRGINSLENEEATGQEEEHSSV